MLRALIGWPLLVSGLYALAGCVGGLVPAQVATVPPAPATEMLYVQTNGLHTSLIVPTERFDPGLLHPADFADPRVLQASHLRFGWGQHRFYREVPRWRDLTLPILVSALITDPRALVHVSAAPNPSADISTRAVPVSSAQMDVILANIAATFRRDAAGRAAAIPGNWPDEAFYAAHGRYSATHTCNNWVAGILNRAGIRTGIWPIYESGVMRWLPASGN